GMTVHGHCLVWHNQTPNFIFENATREGLTETLREHIRLLGSRYGELAETWDVVNEGIEDKTELFYRDTKWHRMYGDHYMDGIFVLAHEMLPGKTLYYNDYNESHPQKREKIYQLVKGMKERGVPIGGIGLQCHHNIYEPGADGLRRAIERYAELGVRLRVTEMDISVFRFEDHTHLAEAPRELMKRQAEVYEQYFELFREYHEQIDAVTLWGIADDETWLDGFPEPGRKNWPLLFDVNHEPKEAYDRIVNF
ncbi:MAG: endo-1,4-beta-xylanase, partial [Lachnospiraceae bacterium]|nr:endo-1,4-beta-xylanase [Lachnospiraceae bacterium]